MSRTKAGDTCVAMAGLGAFPLKVTSFRGQAAPPDQESLLASLPGSLDPDTRSTILAAQEYDEDEIAALLASSCQFPQGEPTAPDYLTAACGLAIGLGLTAGPLFPDILSLISSGSSRLRRGRPSTTTTGGKPSAVPGSNGGIGHWRHGPLSSRLRRETP